jgi:recombinational DNA repair protein RecR
METISSMTDGQEVNRLKLENANLKKRTQEAEGELSIVKGIGNNSPEMKNLKSEVQALKQQIHTDRETHQKEVALVREDAQIDMLDQTKKYADNIFKKDNRIKELEIINKEHQKLNGELQVRLSQYEDQAAHYRRKGVL